MEKVFRIHSQILHHLLEVPLRELPVKAFHKRNSFFSRQVFVSDFLCRVVTSAPKAKFYIRSIIVETVQLVIEAIILAVCSFGAKWIGLKTSMFNRIVIAFLRGPFKVVSKVMHSNLRLL